MGKPAARIGDMHMCPMVTPGLPPVPHVGGPIVGPGYPTVLIGGMPAAVMGDMCVCVGPPDTIVLGSTGVFIGGKPAARMGDITAHGGTITVGFPTVLIGEISGGAVGMASFSSLPITEQVKALHDLNPVASSVIEDASALLTAANSASPFLKTSTFASPNQSAPSGIIDNLLKALRNLVGLNSKTNPEAIVKEVNPNDGSINCGWIIDSVIDRLKGTNPTAVTKRIDQDGTWKEIEERHQTSFSNKRDFKEIFDEVSKKKRGAIQVIGIVGEQNAHVVVITNYNGKAMILEGQGGGKVIESAEEANKLYNPEFYGKNFTVMSAPIN